MFGENKIFESIDNLFDIIDGDRGKNYPKSDELFSEEYCLFLNTKNVTKNGFSFDTKQFITKTKDKLLRKGKLERYDIVLTIRGTVGNVAYYDELIKYKQILLPLPPLALQNEFADFVVQICFFFLAIQKSLEELETLKKSLMQEYFG
ncbi:type I restriction-modification system, S subunit, putative [Streptococcus pneumoniae]|nr:type I restriction-modification system, S subunit, putative [Streptococcus pneumoniae]